MGFLDVAKKGYEALQEKRERIEHYKQLYDRLDDKALYQKWKSSHGDASFACLLLLKERGYLDQSKIRYNKLRKLKIA
ncbi:hypothetical protein ACTQ4E_16600 [Lawsonibacter sp. LCP25S3_G6]|uniref:hypothetical protein n=1 Tax=unclassified Lawsonibacter TaxID=2617946 RepID=UPI003F94B2BC